MNEEERIRRNILDKMGLGALQIMYDKGIQEGFQKGKLEQKKEELKFLLWIDNENLNYWGRKELRERVTKLQKEIGGMK